MDSRIKSCKTMCYAMQSLGTIGCPLPPLIASRLYNGACIPKLLYGVETMHMEDQTIDKLESFHAGSAKMFQGLPENTSNIGSVGLLGWNSIGAKIDIARLLFVWRILLLPMSSIYKKIMITLIISLYANDKYKCNEGPTADIMRTCDCYNLLEDVMHAVLSGCYISMNKWKGHVVKVVNRRDFRSWQIWSTMYSSLHLYPYDELESFKMSQWWMYNVRNPEDGRRCRLMAKCILNSYRLGRVRCEMCNCHFRNSITHILFECEDLISIRNEYWNRIYLYGGVPNLFTEMDNMSYDTRCKFIFGAFRSDYIYEWNSFYRYVLKFVEMVYMSYYKSIKDG